MHKGIAVASEVGCEYSLENCYRLVRTQEQTGTPYMFMENCCYNKDELLATAMARKNMFGTIVHCAGAYAHDLRREVAYGHVNRHYRFDNYLKRSCDNYPTHELGPIANAKTILGLANIAKDDITVVCSMHTDTIPAVTDTAALDAARAAACALLAEISDV